MENVEIKTEKKNVLRTIKAMKVNTIKLTEWELIDAKEAGRMLEVISNALIKYGKEV